MKEPPVEEHKEYSPESGMQSPNPHIVEASVICVKTKKVIYSNLFTEKVTVQNVIDSWAEEDGIEFGPVTLEELVHEKYYSNEPFKPDYQIRFTKRHFFDLMVEKDGRLLPL